LVKLKKEREAGKIKEYNGLVEKCREKVIVLLFILRNLGID
jgi:hypothetical protein